MVQLLWKTVWWFLKILKIELLAIPLQDIYPKELKTGSGRDTCTLTFIAVSSTIAKMWRQPKCPSVDEWIHEMWRIRTMEYYSVLKSKEILTHATTRMKLLDIMLREIRQTLKDKYCRIPLLGGT